MKNKERICWLLLIILLGVFCDRKMQKIDDMQSLITSYDLNNQIKSDQILDLMHEINNGNQNQYMKGYEEGKVYAMIASINGEDLHKYADGYHAAMTQANFDQKLKEYKGFKPAPWIFEMMHMAQSKNSNKELSKNVSQESLNHVTEEKQSLPSPYKVIPLRKNNENKH